MVAVNELVDTLLPLSIQVPVVVVQDVRTSVRGAPGELVLRKGAKLELPLGEALPLVKQGIVAIDHERLPTLQEMNKIRWIESRDPSDLQKLDEDFYLKARLSIALMEQRGEDERKIGAAKAVLVDIIRLRMQKILKAVAANPEPSREFVEKLSIEERALYASLCKSVKVWYTSMIEFVERGDLLA